MSLCPPAADSIEGDHHDPWAPLGHYELKGPITFCLYTALDGFTQVLTGLQAVYMNLHVKLCKPTLEGGVSAGGHSPLASSPGAACTCKPTLDGGCKGAQHVQANIPPCPLAMQQLSQRLINLVWDGRRPLDFTTTRHSHHHHHHHHHHLRVWHRALAACSTLPSSSAASARSRTSPISC